METKHHYLKRSVWPSLFLFSALLVACNKKGAGTENVPPFYQQQYYQLSAPQVTLDRGSCVNCFTDAVTLSYPVAFQSATQAAAFVGNLVVQGSQSQQDALASEGISLGDPLILVKYHGPALVFGSLRNISTFSFGNCTVPAGDYILRPTGETQIITNIIYGAQMEAVHSSGIRFSIYFGKMIPYTPAQNVSFYSSQPPQRVSFDMTLAGTLEHDCGTSTSFTVN